MARKKLRTKKKPDELQRKINLHFIEVVGKVRELDRRVRGLVNYSEYLASNLDLAVSYAEFLSNNVSKERQSQSLNTFQLLPSERTPTFEEFKEIRRKKDDAEIPF
jgi:hypothetical protein